MIILTIRTDQPEAEIGLFSDGQKLAYSSWAAHRQLAETIHNRIQEILDSQAMALADLGGIVVFKGPGSFTGLRIGISVANAFSYSLGIPVVGTMGDNWLADGQDQLRQGKNETAVIPEYGSLPHITAPKH